MFSLRMQLLLLLSFIAASSVLATPTTGSRQPHYGIIFPKESFDECFLDEARQVPGTCKLMEECEPAIKRWQQTRESPKTCYFIKFDHYVCCNHDGIATTTTTTTERPTLPTFTLPIVLRRSLSACYDYNNVKPIDEKDITFVVSVVGGKPTIYREFPFMSALGWRSNFDERIYYRCGGALIAKNFVLTAAHCIDFGGELPAQVRLGGDNLTANQGEDFKIKRIITHPEYNAKLGYNDIALLELDLNSADKPHNLRPACLWAKPDLITTDLTAIGYGQTRFAGLASAQLLKVDLQFVQNEQCQPHYPADVLINGVVGSQLCAGDSTRKRDTCQGDSGGPLLMQDGPLMYVVGITSLGQGCASGPPSIYSRVSSYVDWIEDIVWPLSSTNGDENMITLASVDVRVEP